MDRDGNLEIDANGAISTIPNPDAVRLQRPGSLGASTDLAACRHSVHWPGSQAVARPALTGDQTTLEGICWWWFVSPPHIDHLGVRGHGPLWDDNDVLLHKHFNSSILTRPISELSTSHPAVDIEHGQPRRLRLQHMSQCWRPDATRTATCPDLI